MTASPSTKARTNRPLEIPIPLGTVGPRRPADREQRKDPGALGRHIEERTGVAPMTCLLRRRTDPQSALSLRLVKLWV